MSHYQLYPEIEPFRTGRLQVSSLHNVHYEEVGTEGGRPAVFLHGGPGVGILPVYRRFFDPKVYHLVLPDQRGAGKSTPHAELRENTTWDLVEDLEKIKNHLGIDQWVVLGGSWGSMLALVYAIRHPESVKGLILRGVFLGRNSETDWLFRFGMSEVYPDEWERFQTPIPVEERSDLLKAYYRRLTTGTEEERSKFAAGWNRWESATMNVVPDAETIETFTGTSVALSASRIECHYTVNGFFMPTGNYILENAARIAQIPCRIVQGRHDMICPVRSAWDLHKALPKSVLTIVPLGAHSPVEEAMAAELVRATEDFQKL
jgi:proline iminopeptidase